MPNKPLRCPYCHSVDTEDYEQSLSHCHTCQRQFGRFQEARDIFHQLWGVASRSQSKEEGLTYNKELWHQLQRLMGW